MADFDVQEIAKVCHQVNKAYCEALGDKSQPDWKDAPEWQKESAYEAVCFRLENLDAPASAQHCQWLKAKEEAGWKYGSVKDPEKKEHPCMVPFEQLPKEQQAKDYIFKAIVHELAFDE